MFNDDELRSALTKMHNYTPVNGFKYIAEDLGDMMKSLANEPSVGLFHVQEHTQNAVPRLVNLRTSIVAKARDVGLHTEDSEDSITMVRSMSDCGFQIVDDMVKDIRKALGIMSSKQPKKGLISSRAGSGFKGRVGWKGNVNVNVIDVEKSTTLVSSVGDELPVSSRGEEEEVSDRSGLESFDKFKDDKEARFKEWLEGKDA
ncbi:uncharacterized protein LOC143570775 [Bidens hawaiensis]|uniref:uncharacterized protein LOC143570775 n=1 Tax=Bidens hawaiensis TaxID=980011 RepID=UPI00404AE7F5